MSNNLKLTVFNKLSKMFFDTLVTKSTLIDKIEEEFNFDKKTLNVDLKILKGEDHSYIVFGFKYENIKYKSHVFLNLFFLIEHKELLKLLIHNLSIEQRESIKMLEVFNYGMNKIYNC